jgi:hypothetical protein
MFEIKGSSKLKSQIDAAYWTKSLVAPELRWTPFLKKSKEFI